MACNNLAALTQQQYSHIYKNLLGNGVKNHGSVTHGEVFYSITGRGYDILERSTYPQEYLQDLTPDMRILDVGTGSGHFVDDLHGKGFTLAEGVDIGHALPKDKPYLKRVAIEDTDYPDNYFDRIFSSYSIFYYDEPEAFQQQALEKMARMLKPGGHIRLAPLSSTDALKRVVAKIPALRVTDEGPDDRYIQLTKVQSNPVKHIAKEALDVLA